MGNYYYIIQKIMLEYNRSNQYFVQKYKEMQRQLYEAHLQIKALKDENELLKERLARFQNQQSTYCMQSQESVEAEVFTESSCSDSQDFQAAYVNLNEQAQQAPFSERSHRRQQQSPEISVLTPLSVTKALDKTPTKVIFNYQSQGSHIPKLLTKQSKKQISKPLMNNNSSDVMLQYQQNTGNYSAQHSAIKSESPILIKNMNNTLFQRVKNSNKIFDTFFVTGYAFDAQSPKIDYCYPTASKHFQAILSLIYTENSLKPMENAIGRSPKIAGFKPGKLTIKDSFVMILCKGESGERQYLFACEVDDVFEGPDRNFYIFNRLFCFITSCNFFSAFIKIMEQFIIKLNDSRQQQFGLLSPLQTRNPKQLIASVLEQHLRFLYQKNITENQSISLGLGKQISIFIDVPSAMESYRTLLDYRPWGILFCPVYLSQDQDIKEKQLFGFLLVYLITETKVMLYSMVKSKISEAILHALEMIKPLEYVNPIIMGTIRDEHQQYFNAPMSVILGLWGEVKAKRKQKIEIFMNKKASFSNLSGIIEENKMGNIDGVVFNLDTGYTFGNGLSSEKNKLAIELNHLMHDCCKSTKEKYKLFECLMRGKSQVEHSQIRDLSQKIINVIKGTQLYSVYKDKNQSTFRS